MTETSARIRWEDNERRWDDDGSILGYVGTRNEWLFQIAEANADDADETLALVSRLPGEDRPGTSPEKLKAEAERWLTEFVTSLGAVFPEPGFEFDDDDGEPLEVKYAAGKRVRYVHPDYGYPGEHESAAAILVLGVAYTIAQHSIGQSRTGLILEGIPGEWFNSVLFEPVDDETPAPTAGEKE